MLYCYFNLIKFINLLIAIFLLFFKIINDSYKKYDSNIINNTIKIINIIT